MTSPVDVLTLVVSTLQSSPLCLSVAVIQEKVFSGEQFVLKVRAQLVNEQSLQVYLYHNRGHYDYAYQVFGIRPLMRWDNKEDCPGLANFPHHFHPGDAAPVASSLTGEPVADLQIVLTNLEKNLPSPVTSDVREVRRFNKESDALS